MLVLVDGKRWSVLLYPHPRDWRWRFCRSKNYGSLAFGPLFVTRSF